MTTTPIVPTGESKVRRGLFTFVAGLSALIFSALPMVHHADASQDNSTSLDQAGALQLGDFPMREANRTIRVYDTVDILTGGQETSLEGELARLRGLGVEALIYTRMSDDTAAESQAFADRLRVDWGVQSIDGADDGIVYLITVNPAAPETNSILISSGPDTFPVRQLDHATMQDVLSQEMAPQIEDGKFNIALLFGVRRVLNHAEYSPPNPPARTALRDDLRFVSNILAAGLLQLAAIGYFLVPAMRERRLTFLPSARSLAIYAVAIGCLAVATGIVAIAGRSTFASLTALGVVLWVGGVLPILIGHLSRQDEQHTPRALESAGPKPAQMIGQSNG